MRHKRSAGTLAAKLALAILAVPGIAPAQATEATILGTVLDSSGAAVPGAAVTVTSVETGLARQAITNAAGEYVVTNLSLGSYTVSAELKGFKRAVHPAVPLTVKARVRVDLTLEIGEVNQSVEVSGAAPLLKTDSPELGGAVSQQMLQNVPIFGRNYLAIAAVVPGTTRGSKTDRRRDFAGEAVTVSGLSSESNNFIVDGVSMNNELIGGMSVVPPIDSLGEFAVQTSQFAAEFGRSGGGVVNLALKSGTNQFHGFAYDYLRNDALDARPYDFTGTNPAKQPLRRNQFGGGLGGPIKRNKIFFFGNYEGLRFPNNVVTTQIVPTALQKGGDFSQSGFTIADPFSNHPDPANPGRLIRTPFPDNIIPRDRIDPIGAGLLKYYPDPNYKDPNPNVQDNYITTQTNRDQQNGFTVKTDFNVSQTDTVNVHYTQQRGGRIRSGWLPDNRIGAQATLNGSNAGVSYIKVLSPNLVNEARAGYNYGRSGNDILVHDNVVSQFNIPGLGINPAAAGFPRLRMQNITSGDTVRPIASVPSPFIVVEHSFQWLDTLSWHKGNHALKFGVEVGRIRSDRAQGLPGDATIQFNGSYSTPVVGQALESRRNGVADALLGVAVDYETQYVFDAIRLRASRFAWFAQDDWRVTRKLTLSLGLRHEINPQYHELRDRMVNFDFGAQQRVVPEGTRMIVANALGLPNGNLPPTFRYAPLDQVIPSTNYRNLAPRFGFAYAANERLVFRGGYGIFYGVTVGNNFSNAGTEPPFFTDLDIPGELEKPNIVRQGFPSSGALSVMSAPTLGFYYGPLRRHDPYSQKYTFNVQVSPTRRVVFEAGYTGQHALAFPALVRMNYPMPGPGNIQARRPIPQIGGGTGYLPINDSSYNALETSVRINTWHGFTVQSAFTFSKVLGLLSGTDGGILTDPYNFRYDYGPEDYDFRRRWVTLFVYDLPSAKALPRLPRFILSSWQIASLITLQGGFPFSVLVTGQVLNNGLSNNRANVLRDPNLPVDQRTRSRWFDTSAFAAPAQYTWGNQGKNIVRAPGLAQVDFALQKSIPIREGMRAILRMEASNLFNRVNLDAPAATLGGSNFGVIRSLAAGPRQIQLVGRFEF